ncbi:condensation domain-containing protein, partial [Streptomyces sp. 7-21]|uniref:condensation domain-containing protein n=1 Tax=Streptomyces sp. 7-21 TaxID=2802283 RepID=UPI001A54657D
MTRSPIEDVWPLSPLQEGLLFHASFDDEGPDVYTIQTGQELLGPVDPDRLRRSWGALVARHAVLRASFRQVSGAQTVQVISRHVTLPWRQADLSALPEDEALAEIERLSEEERAARFDLAVPPLLRVLLVTLGPGRHRMVITSHHILLDGWSVPLLLGELQKVYEAGADVRALPPVRSYRDYLAWLARQDRAAAEEAWRRELAGADEPTLVAPADPGRRPVLAEHVVHDLTEAATAGVSEFARGRGLTVNTVVQAAWALVVARLSGRNDVVFGATVAGRPTELPGVESMVGLFINTVPVRVPLRGEQPVTELLTDLQERQAQLLPHQYLGLTDLQRLAGPGAVFDSLVVFENYPHPPARPASPDTLSIRPVGAAFDSTHYPFTLAVIPGKRIRLRLD